MNKHGVAFLCLMLGSIAHLVTALDLRQIEITVNTAVPGNTAFRPSMFTVGMLRAQGIETLQVTIENSSDQVLLVGPDLLIDVIPLNKETVGDILWSTPRRVNLLMSTLGVLGMVMTLGYYGLSNVIKNWRPKVMLGSGSALILFSMLFTGIENMIWNRMSESILHVPATINPGQTVSKFVYISSETMSAKSYACKVYDMQQVPYTLNASVISV